MMPIKFLPSTWQIAGSTKKRRNFLVCPEACEFDFADLLFLIIVYKTELFPVFFGEVWLNFDERDLT